MDSFYGGRPGSPFIIKARFNSYVEMMDNFSDRNRTTTDPTYTEVFYGDYCIIDTVNKNDVDNGKIYRRTYSGAEYIGQIVGPTGGTPSFAITTLDGVDGIIKEYAQEKNENGDFLYYQPKKDENGKEIKDENGNVVYETKEDEDGNETEIKTTTETDYPVYKEIANNPYVKYPTGFDEDGKLITNIEKEIVRNSIGHESSQYKYTGVTEKAIGSFNTSDDSLVSGKEHEDIQWSWVQLRNDEDDSMETTFYVGFQIPYPVVEMTAASWSGYDENGKRTEDVNVHDKYSFKKDEQDNLVLDTEKPPHLGAEEEETWVTFKECVVNAQTHPYYYPFHFEVPRGIRGMDIRNLRVLRCETDFSVEKGKLQLTDTNSGELYIGDYILEDNTILQTQDSDNNEEEIIFYDAAEGESPQENNTDSEDDETVYNLRGIYDPTTFSLDDNGHLDLEKLSEWQFDGRIVENSNDSSTTEQLNGSQQEDKKLLRQNFAILAFDLYDHSETIDVKYTCFAGYYDVVEGVELDSEGNLTFIYSASPNKTDDDKIKYIKDIELDAAVGSQEEGSGKFTVIYNTKNDDGNEKSEFWLPVIHDAGIDTETGLFNINYNNSGQQYYYEQQRIPEKDENGNEIKDEDGNIVYQTKEDENGNVVYVYEKAIPSKITTDVTNFPASINDYSQQLKLLKRIEYYDTTGIIAGFYTAGIETDDKGNLLYYDYDFENDEFVLDENGNKKKTTENTGYPVITELREDFNYGGSTDTRISYVKDIIVETDGRVWLKKNIDEDETLEDDKLYANVVVDFIKEVRIIKTEDDCPGNNGLLSKRRYHAFGKHAVPGAVKHMTEEEIQGKPIEEANPDNLPIFYKLDTNDNIACWEDLGAVQDYSGILIGKVLEISEIPGNSDTAGKDIDVARILDYLNQEYESGLTDTENNLYTGKVVTVTEKVGKDLIYNQPKTEENEILYVRIKTKTGNFKEMEEGTSSLYVLKTNEDGTGFPQIVIYKEEEVKITSEYIDYLLKNWNNPDYIERQEDSSIFEYQPYYEISYTEEKTICHYFAFDYDVREWKYIGMMEANENAMPIFTAKEVPNTVKYLHFKNSFIDESGKETIIPRQPDASTTENELNKIFDRWVAYPAQEDQQPGE